MRAAQPNKVRRAFAESTAPDCAIPPPPAQLGLSDDHAAPIPPPTALPSEWRTWAQRVRDLRPTWVAAQTEASTDMRDAGDSREASTDIDTAPCRSTCLGRPSVSHGSNCAFRYDEIYALSL